MSKQIDGPAVETTAIVASETLDPADWQAFRAQAHRMLDDMLAYTEKIRERPVWQPIPEEMRARRSSAVPRFPSDVGAVHEEFMQAVLPFAAANTHPGFMGWVQGGGTPVGMLAEMLAAGLNANLGGRNQIPIEVEREVLQWVRQIFGFPEGASGLFVTGASMANLMAVVVARDAVLGQQVRVHGLAAEARRLTAYASTAVHGCIGKAMDIAGLGSEALRLVRTDSRFRIDIEALEDAVGKDRAAGLTPFLVVGTAGTVDTGAIDNLAALAAFCERERLWFHVDGALGALAMLAPDLGTRLNGIERADSLAFDFHKWGQVPYDAGFLLVRDGQLHRQAFASSPEYLKQVERGLAGGAPWPCDFGPDLSRGFRALKAWFTLKVYGTEALGAAIARTCELAQYLEDRIHAEPELELLAPVSLNIVCFRYLSPNTGQADGGNLSLDADSLNQEIVIRLQESGIVAPSTTRIAGRLAIRAALVNHRTSRAEIDALVVGTLTLGRSLPAVPSPGIAVPPEQAQTAQEAGGAPLQLLDERLAAEPGSSELLFQRGNVLEQMGRSPEAIEAYSQALVADPAHRGALNNLGNLLSAAGQTAEARRVHALAAASHPADPMSLVNFANDLRKDGENEAARAYFARALAADPDYWQAHLGISAVLAELGEAERAAVHRRRAFQGRCVVPMPYRGTQAPITVLELIAVDKGNTRLKLFMPDRIFKRYVVTTEFYDSATTLPPHDLVVNAIGDADCAGAALQGAQALLAHTTAPVINAPAAVLATGRCQIARRLARIPGVVTAQTLILPRAELAAPDAPETLARHGFVFPLLLRTPGFHGGDNFVRVENGDGIAPALATLPGSELMVMEYLDARGRDGKSRKYRAMMIDGKLYPLHAAISHHWKIHYYSAEMGDVPEHRAEDAAFLDDMNGVLGGRAMNALHSIQTALGLDYGGIDFGLNEQGEVLLFEANATMTVVPPEKDERWDYRRPAVERVCKAVFEMLAGRATTTS